MNKDSLLFVNWRKYRTCRCLSWNIHMSWISLGKSLSSWSNLRALSINLEGTFSKIKFYQENYSTYHYGKKSLTHLQLCSEVYEIFIFLPQIQHKSLIKSLPFSLYKQDRWWGSRRGSWIATRLTKEVAVMVANMRSIT